MREFAVLTRPAWSRLAARAVATDSRPSASVPSTLEKLSISRTVAPNRRPYETKDGHVAALIYNDKHWAAFIEAIQPTWNRDEYATLTGRAKQIDTVYGLVAQTMRERTTKEWLDLFGELEIPATPINSLDALFDSPQLNAAGMFETVQTSTGPVRFPGVPTWFSRTPGRVRGPAPEPAADTVDVLGELGITPPATEGAV